MSDLALRFMALFKGLERAHGSYQLDGTSSARGDGQKMSGRAITKRNPVTLDLWEAHIDGKQGLGIIPIRDDSAVLFAAIDIDVYPLDAAQVAQKIQSLGLPLLPCRSKSGGVHAYIFFSEPVSASVVVPKLKEFALALGFGGVETFPKQTQVLAERGDIGNWINVPYFDAANTTRHGVRPDGSAMSAEDFLTTADSLKQTAKSLKKFRLSGSDLTDGPPCLQTLTKQGFPAGCRNSGLANLCVYLRKSNPAGWKEEVQDYNERFMNPPLDAGEVATIISSVSKKDYRYGCKNDPLKAHCDGDLCRKRKHGVGQTTETPTLSALTKYNSDPPIWFVEVEGQGRMELSSDALQNQKLFQKRCMEVLHQMPPEIKKQRWVEMIAELLEKVHVIEVPQEATPAGQLLEFLEQFCTSKAQGQTRDDILTGKPWLDNGQHHFRLRNFKDYLKRQNFRELSDHQVSVTIQEAGGAAHETTIKGKFVRYWTFPEFKTQSEPLDVPKFAKPPEPF